MKSTIEMALEALEAGEYYIDDLEAIVYAADDIGVHEDRAKMQAAITTLRKALAEQPAQRMWAGLTDREKIMCRSYDIDEAIANTEAKLKEKNT